MIELIFVIVVLGILASIAIPKFAATRDDAHIAKARATVAAVRSAIVNERQARLFRGSNVWITSLDSGGSLLFDTNGTGGGQLLMYPETAGTGKGSWSRSADNTYVFNLGENSATFLYTPGNGSFTCTDGACNLYQ